jgi:hypothetical protein
MKVVEIALSRGIREKKENEARSESKMSAHT